jgi:hypothetical protein
MNYDNSPRVEVLHPPEASCLLVCTPLNVKEKVLRFEYSIGGTREANEAVVKVWQFGLTACLEDTPVVNVPHSEQEQLLPSPLAIE